MSNHILQLKKFKFIRDRHQNMSNKDRGAVCVCSCAFCAMKMSASLPSAEASFNFILPLNVVMSFD